MKTVCILGGTGFVGGHLAARLVQQGLRVRIPSRRPERHRHLRVLQGVEVTQANIFDPAQLSAQLTGCDAVVNLVAVLNESKTANFKTLHEELPKLVVEACYATNVSRLLHMSSLKSDPQQGTSEYAKSKGRGEQIALAAEKLNVTSYKPSVIFGRDDAFFNRFASLLKLTPCCFPLACPEAKFAPIWVNDVVEFMVRSLDKPHTYGKTYELCGAEVYSLKELLEFTAGCLNLKRRIIPLNDKFSRLQARILGMIPGKPMSYDNYLSMQCDNVCEINHLAEFAIQPANIASIVPTYLGGQNSRAHYDTFRYQARR